MKKWFVIGILAIAQFVMVLDSTVMNVSLSTVAGDLHTTISGMQTAITLYTLTMAALMLTGGKLGDIWGRRRAFVIGSIVYGLGSFITSLAPNLTTLLIGWSIVEGLGAVLVIPAIAALAAINYEGKDRVVAFAVIGAISGAAAAAGPLIGGFMTTYLSWRYVFVGETIIMILVLLLVHRIRDEKITKRVTIDWPSAILSMVGMGVLVFGILQSKTWGWITPLGAPEINGQPITPLGISLVAYMILAGAVILWCFYDRQRRLEAAGKTALLKVSLLKLPTLRSGLAVLLAQYFITAAIFFVIPVYLQTILGYDALQTGIKIFPLSVALILASIIGTRMALTRTPRRIVRIGQVALIVGCSLLLASISPELRSGFFASGMFVAGLGLGLLASQLGNINMTAVGNKNAAEGGGLQGTFQNLGSSLGTALVGSVFIASLTTGFVGSINQSSLSSSVKAQVNDSAKAGVQIVSQSQAQELVLAKGATPEEAQTITQSYVDAQVNGLREAMFAIIALSILALLLSRSIPDKIER